MSNEAKRRSPGSWTLIKFDGDDFYTITMEEATDQVIAVTDGNQADLSEGNANLIASAPDLLEACKTALIMAENIRRETGGAIEGSICWTLRTAITKAEGNA